MTLFVRLIQGLGRRAGRGRQAWNRFRFLTAQRLAHCPVELGKDCVFHVPVRNGGTGSIRLGNRNVFGSPTSVRLGNGEILIQARGSNARVQIGDENLFSNNVSIVAGEQITLGDRCQIGDLATVFDCDFHELNPATRCRSAGPTRPVRIGSNVWLGSRVMVLKGVHIGDNAVIAAASVVTRDVPANCVAAGVPARVIRHLE